MELPHVVIFPYDEYGHTTPAYALGCTLASTRRVRVTLALTPTRYAHCLRTPPESGLFCIVAIPDGEIDTRKRDDVCFQHSLQKLEPGLESLMLQMRPRPSCLISDVIYSWSQDLALRLQIPCFHFSVFPATSVLIVFHLPLLISKGLLPFQPGMEDKLIDFIPGLPEGFRLFADVPVDFRGRNCEELEVLSRILHNLKRGAGIVINSTYELEPDAMDALSAEGLSMYAVGPMSNMNLMPYLIAEDMGCLQWLDDQPQGAVVYVALGTLVSLTEEEVQEVALGLEACGQPFLWVLRPPASACSGGIDQMSALPAGFEKRTKARGRVISWAPQVAVLAHAAVGCFLSHCGMGSVLEALWAGVPIIGGFSKVSDQNTICRLVTKEWGVGMALQDRIVVQHQPPLRCAVEECVKEVLHGERGQVLSQRATELQAVMRKAVDLASGSSYLSLSKLGDALYGPIPQ